MSDKVRTFVAIELPAEIKSEIAFVQERLTRRGLSHVKWVAPQSSHLTLKFLGDVDSLKIPQVIEAVKAATSAVKPFELELTGLGVFPSFRQPRVVWAGIEGDTIALSGLQESVDIELAKLGFEREDREFTPHLTIGRVREGANASLRTSIGEAVRTEQVGQLGKFSVDAASIMRSTLAPTGAIHELIGRAQLKPRSA